MFVFEVIDAFGELGHGLGRIGSLQCGEVNAVEQLFEYFRSAVFLTLFVYDTGHFRSHEVVVGCYLAFSHSVMILVCHRYGVMFVIS